MIRLQNSEYSRRNKLVCRRHTRTTGGMCTRAWTSRQSDVCADTRLTRRDHQSQEAAFLSSRSQAAKLASYVTNPQPDQTDSRVELIGGIERFVGGSKRRKNRDRSQARLDDEEQDDEERRRDEHLFNGCTASLPDESLTG